jgi:hypothetical protein
MFLPWAGLDCDPPIYALHVAVTAGTPSWDRGTSGNLHYEFPVTLKGGKKEKHDRLEEGQCED